MSSRSWYSSRELTWIEKGLRHVKFACIVSHLMWENWPELRRDYDPGSTPGVSIYPHFWENWPELRRDYDPTYARPFRWNALGENWPELRRDYDRADCIIWFPQRFLRELTWIEKGLRLLFFFVESESYSTERTDLNWEGITTVN